MNNKYGGVVVYEGKDLEAVLVSWFTNSIWTHSALKLNDSFAHTITKDGEKYRRIVGPDPDFKQYVILENPDLDDIDRKELRRLHRTTSRTYDSKVIMRLARRNLSKENYDALNISSGQGMYNCSSRIAYLYDKLGIPIIPGIHWSQIVPHHFIDSRFFKRVE